MERSFAEILEFKNRTNLKTNSFSSFCKEGLESDDLGEYIWVRIRELKTNHIRTQVLIVQVIIWLISFFAVRLSLFRNQTSTSLFLFSFFYSLSFVSVRSKMAGKSYTDAERAELAKKLDEDLDNFMETLAKKKKVSSIYEMLILSQFLYS